MSYEDNVVDAASVEMPVTALPNEPFTNRSRYRCGVCKKESEYPFHNLAECVKALAVRLDRMESRTMDDR